jgi:hypothetical protein
MAKLFKYKKFKSKNKKPKGRIFVIGPFTGKLYQFKFLCLKLAKEFEVIQIQTEDEILNYAKPENLESGINEVGNFIAKNQALDMPNFLVGISLGSYISFFAIPELNLISKYFFVGGGIFISRATSSPVFKKVMSFDDYDDLIIKKAEKTWKNFEDSRIKNINTGQKKIVLVVSKNDELIVEDHLQEVLDALSDDESLSLEFTNLPSHKVQVAATNLYSNKIKAFFLC